MMMMMMVSCHVHNILSFFSHGDDRLSPTHTHTYTEKHRTASQFGDGGVRKGKTDDEQDQEWWTGCVRNAQTLSSRGVRSRVDRIDVVFLRRMLRNHDRSCLGISCSWILHSEGMSFDHLSGSEESVQEMARGR